MKALIIIPGMYKYLPYITLYTNMFKKNNVKYRILQWDRMYETIEIKDDIFRCGYAYSNNPFNRIISYCRYIKWVKRETIKYNPDLIIVATIAPAILLLPILNKWKYKFILDIRDYSPLIKIFMPFICRCIKLSKYTLISSKGFTKWLPPYNYLPIYNIGTITFPQIKKIDLSNITISTIGFLRDFEENKKIIDAFGNKNDIILKFHGNGIVLDRLILYTNKKCYRNVIFTGFYDKKHEADLYKDSDIINIFMPEGLAGSTLISNRFINSVSNIRPMIVTKGSYQAELVKEYKLGVIVSSSEDIYKETMKYLRSFKYEEFKQNCQNYLNKILDEHNDTINKIEKILEQ